MVQQEKKNAASGKKKEGSRWSEHVYIFIFNIPFREKYRSALAAAINRRNEREKVRSLYRYVYG